MSGVTTITPYAGLRGYSTEDFEAFGLWDSDL